MARKNTKNTTPVANVTPATETPVTPVINGVVTKIATPKIESVLMYTVYERKSVKFECDPAPFKNGAIATTMQVNPDDFVKLKAAESIPNGALSYDSLPAAMRAIAAKRCREVEKAEAEARNERIRKAGYTFKAYEAERIALHYTPSAKLQNDSDIAWDLRCVAKRVDANFAVTKGDMAFAIPEDGGILEQARQLYKDMVAIRTGAPGAKSGKQFEKDLADLYKGIPTHTAFGRRVCLLKGCVPTAHNLTAKVENDKGKKVTVDADTYGADDREQNEAKFVGLIFASDAIVSEMPKK